MTSLSRFSPAFRSSNDKENTPAQTAETVDKNRAVFPQGEPKDANENEESDKIGDGNDEVDSVSTTDAIIKEKLAATNFPFLSSDEESSDDNLLMRVSRCLI